MSSASLNKTFPSLLITIYGRNNDNPNIFLRVIQYIEAFENEQYLICGDFNLVLDQYLYTKNICTLTILKLKKRFWKNNETLDMREPFRELNPYLRRLARLDMFLLSNNLMFFVQKVIIENSYMCDNSGVVLYMELSKIRKRNSWRKILFLNNTKWTRLFKATSGLTTNKLINDGD